MVAGLSFAFIATTAPEELTRNLGLENCVEFFLARIAPYFLYGCATWIVLVVAYFGRVCSETYSIVAGLTWLFVYTLLGFIVWIPFVTVVAGLAYVAATKTPLTHTPRLRRSAAVAILAAIFIITAIAAPPNR